MSRTNDRFSAQFLKGAEKQKASQEQQQAARQRAQETAARKARQEALLKEKRHRRAFSDYYRNVAPLLDVLSSLPAKDGKEFFVRTALSTRPDVEDKENTRIINIWIVYSHISPQLSAQSIPQTHTLAMQAKNDPEKIIDLALQDTPYLQLKAHQKGRAKEIKSAFIEESYTYAPQQRQRGLYRGDYRVNQVESQQQAHKSLQDFVPVIGAWVQHVAPDRLPEIVQGMARPQVSVEQKIAVKKPLTLKPKGF